ncbi:MAG: pantoate--beta-alanine ligase [Lentisphaeria bacterium]|nr:pantoate--beta-alanine ligase [Lentisphaeria bacterium]
MTVFKTRRELQKFALEAKRQGKIIGLVPTMGYLHAGHTSLIDIARKRADVVIVSVFVNPTQFAPTEDLDRYPRDFDRDLKLCTEHGADAIFAPEPGEMYSADASTWVTETMLSRPLCGASRPTFFRGVTTVVSKLFLLAQPDFAVFGLKDAQQLFVIRRMVRDLDFPVEIVAAPLVRDTDGLALSSRNRYLSADERTRALSIHRTLLDCKAEILSHGLAAAPRILAAGKAALAAAGGKVDYLEVLDSGDLEAVDGDTREVLLAAAVFFGTTRLIDNELFEVER